MLSLYDPRFDHTVIVSFTLDDRRMSKVVIWIGWDLAVKEN